MSTFFDELKRRKVYRVAIAYIVAGWALAQGLAQVLPVFEISNSVIRVVIALLLIGFPVALVLAWIFDITPQGIRATEPAPTMTPMSRRGRRNILILLLVGVVLSAAAGFFVLPRAVAHKIDKSIAVLPFENLSDDKENAYFADGIQDDVLTNLSKIGDLKVISRTSVMGYRGKTPKIREIGKTLGVSNILEGSVRRSGNKVRVNVQLIDATNDQHVWAEDYDGELTDVFKIQSELATKIASALQAKLSPSEKENIAHKPTQIGDAYLAYQRAHNVHSSALEDFSRLKIGEELYEQAINLDPNFALALARYSQLESWISHTFDPSPARKQKAVDLAERALRLEPALSEAHLARGFAYYYGDRNYEAALKEFAIAQQGLPNDSEAYLAIGAIQRRQGKWQESTENLKKAAELDPKSSWPLQNLAFNYQMLRDSAACEQTINKALELSPNSLELLGLKIQFAIEQHGDFSVYEHAMATLDPANRASSKTPTLASASDLTPTDFNEAYVEVSRLSVLMLQRKFQEAVSVAEKINENAISGKPELVCQKFGYLGLARRYLHDEAGARRDLLKAKETAQKLLAQSPDLAPRHMQLAQVLALLGEKDAALTEAFRARELLPESIDAFEGPQITQNLAEVYSILGDAGHATELLDGLFNRPSAITTHILKLQPFWDPIRKDPRFQALIDKYSAKT
jgi:TolB-like protein/Flp pilus assembly protein TadD